MQNETTSDTGIAEEWDVEELQVVEPKAGSRRRAIFSVRFSAAELGLVESKARALGKPVGEFIRESALASSEPGSVHPVSLEDAIAEIRRAGGSVAFPAIETHHVQKSWFPIADPTHDTLTVIKYLPLPQKTPKRRIRPRDHSRVST